MHFLFLKQLILISFFSFIDIKKILNIAWYLSDYKPKTTFLDCIEPQRYNGIKISLTNGY